MNTIVAFDGSDESSSALRYAADIAAAVDGEITVVNVADPYVYDEGGTEPISTFADADERLISESLEDAEHRGLAVLERAEELAAELGHEVETELLYGEPVGEIAAYAKEQGCDAIYVGHRGRSERGELLLGSVAKGLVERATVPVTVVR